MKIAYHLKLLLWTYDFAFFLLLLCLGNYKFKIEKKIETEITR